MNRAVALLALLLPTSAHAQRIVHNVVQPAFNWWVANGQEEMAPSLTPEAWWEMEREIGPLRPEPLWWRELHLQVNHDDPIVNPLSLPGDVSLIPGNPNGSMRTTCPSVTVAGNTYLPCITTNATFVQIVMSDPMDTTHTPPLDYALCNDGVMSQIPDNPSYFLGRASLIMPVGDFSADPQQVVTSGYNGKWGQGAACSAGGFSYQPYGTVTGTGGAIVLYHYTASDPNLGGVPSMRLVQKGDPAICNWQQFEQAWIPYVDPGCPSSSACGQGHGPILIPTLSPANIQNYGHGDYERVNFLFQGNQWPPNTSKPPNSSTSAVNPSPAQLVYSLDPTAFKYGGELWASWQIQYHGLFSSTNDPLRKAEQGTGGMAIGPFTMAAGIDTSRLTFIVTATSDWNYCDPTGAKGHCDSTTTPLGPPDKYQPYDPNKSVSAGVGKVVVVGSRGVVALWNSTYTDLGMGNCGGMVCSTGYYGEAVRATEIVQRTGTDGKAKFFALNSPVRVSIANSAYAYGDINGGYAIDTVSPKTSQTVSFGSSNIAGVGRDFGAPYDNYTNNMSRDVHQVYDIGDGYVYNFPNMGGGDGGPGAATPATSPLNCAAPQPIGTTKPNYNVSYYAYFSSGSTTLNLISGPSGTPVSDGAFYNGTTKLTAGQKLCPGTTLCFADPTTVSGNATTTALTMSNPATATVTAAAPVQLSFDTVGYGVNYGCARVVVQRATEAALLPSPGVANSLPGEGAFNHNDSQDFRWPGNPTGYNGFWKDPTGATNNWYWYAYFMAWNNTAYTTGLGGVGAKFTGSAFPATIDAVHPVLQNLGSSQSQAFLITGFNSSPPPASPSMSGQKAQLGFFPVDPTQWTHWGTQAP